MLIKDWKFKDVVLLNLREKIEVCRTKFETETSTNVIWATQGKLEGFRLIRDQIVERFGDLEGTVSRENSPEITNLSRAELESFQGDILNSADNWDSIDSFVQDSETRAKNELYDDEAATSRSIKLAHGKRDGLRICRDLMDTISNALEEAKENPTLFDEDQPEPALVIEGDFEGLEETIND